MGTTSPLLIAALQPVKAAKKTSPKKKPGEMKKGKSNTQVGEQAAAQPSSVGAVPWNMNAQPETKTPAQELKEAARREKFYATRRWVEGRIGTKHHDELHRRANHVIKHGGRNLPPAAAIKEKGPLG